MKALLNAIETTLKAASVLAYVNSQITCAVNGLFPEGWTNNGVVLSPGKRTPQNYPAGMANHTELMVIVYCYSEFFGERIGLMGDGHFKGILDMERDVLDVLTPRGNADFCAFDGLVSACFWQGTVYPEFNRRTFDGWNECRIALAYRN